VAQIITTVAMISVFMIEILFQAQRKAKIKAPRS
jgi:hypothetical protein